MLTFKRLKKLMKGSYLVYCVALAATILNAAGQMLSPIIVRVTLDSILGSEPLNAPQFIASAIERLGGVGNIADNLWMCTVALFTIAVINGSFGFIRGRSVWHASESMAKRLKDRLYDHLQKMPYDYHIKAQTGDLIQRCTSDVETVRRFVNGAVMEIGRTLFLMAFSIAVMASVNVKLTLVSVASLPFLFLFSLIFFVKVKKAFLKSDEKEGELSAVLQENLSGVRVVRAFGRQKHELEKFESRNSELRGLNRRVIRLLAIYWSSSDLICFGQIVSVLLFGVYLAYQGEITVGTVIMFNTYVGMLVWPVRQMGRFLSDMGKMQVAAGRVYEILDAPEETDTEGATKPDLKGDIVFENVMFEYEKGKEILKGITFCVNRGETIAILGATGSGKSTLMHILLRLYDYKDGSIKINGVELRNIQKKYLREKIGIVLQEPFLFSKTIRENVRMANGEATDHDIQAVAETAAVHKDIEGFEKGYDTIVGEKGITLSGGQKQRVAIARTLIKNSDILIFDDSLSAVDTETDSQIRAALKERPNGATTFIISQRITTLMQADRIFVIEGGKLSAQGTHKELIEIDGLYSRIWAIQSMLSDDFDDEISGANGQDIDIVEIKETKINDAAGIEISGNDSEEGVEN